MINEKCKQKLKNGFFCRKIFILSIVISRKIRTFVLSNEREPSC